MRAWGRLGASEKPGTTRWLRGGVYTDYHRTKSEPSMRRAHDVRRDIAAAALAWGRLRPPGPSRTAGRRPRTEPRVRRGVKKLERGDPSGTG